MFSLSMAGSRSGHPSISLFLFYLLTWAPTPKYGLFDVLELAEVDTTPLFSSPWMRIAYRPPEAIA